MILPGPWFSFVRWSHFCQRDLSSWFVRSKQNAGSLRNRLSSLFPSSHCTRSSCLGKLQLCEELPPAGSNSWALNYWFKAWQDDVICSACLPYNQDSDLIYNQWFSPQVTMETARLKVHREVSVTRTWIFLLLVCSCSPWQEADLLPHGLLYAHVREVEFGCYFGGIYRSLEVFTSYSGSTLCSIAKLWEASWCGNQSSLGEISEASSIPTQVRLKVPESTGPSSHK